MMTKCAHCGAETPEAVSLFGEIHLVGCPANIVEQATGDPLVMTFEQIMKMFGVPSDQPAAGAEQNPNNRAVLLDEAEALINGARAGDYGDAAENFERIAHGWSEILGQDVTRVQVALCMDWLKTCRLITSPGHRDSWLDKLGYTALGGEVSAL